MSQRVQQGTRRTITIWKTSNVRFSMRRTADYGSLYFGYSAGGNVAIMFAADDDSKVPYIVNSSGRFVMDQIEATLGKDEAKALERDGKFIFKFTKRGQPQEVISTSQDIEQFKNISMRDYASRIPAKTRVLCTHGSRTQGYPSRILVDL